MLQRSSAGYIILRDIREDRMRAKLSLVGGCRVDQ